MDADAGGDAADLPGQTRAGRGEVGRRGARSHARPQYWKVRGTYADFEVQRGLSGRIVGLG